MEKKIKLLAAAIPVAMLLISITAFIVNTRIAEGKPIITELNPNIVSSGEELIIYGENFGDKKESSRVFISSLDLLSKYIISWSDTSIKIQIPEKAESGLVSVEGEFSQGDVIIINDKFKAIAGSDSSSMRKIIGCHSKDIKKILGEAKRDVISRSQEIIPIDDPLSKS